MRLFGTLTLLSLLALACGGDPSAPSEGLTSPSPTASAPVSSPVAVRPGAYPASAEGVCQMWSACGCLTDPMSACLSTMTGEGMNASIHSCIVQAGCGACNDAVSLACINDHYAAASAASRAQHERNMEIINNYPQGGNCSGGLSPVYQGGVFIGCR